MLDTPPPAPADRPIRAGRLAALLAEAAAQVRFFSRLPIPRLGPADDPAAPPPFPRAIRMLPPAALVVAAPAAALVALLTPTALSSLTLAVLAVALAALITGGLHEDGLADVADAFAGGRTVERRLEIMKDSRIGAFGGIALIAQFLLRATLLAELIDRLDVFAGACLLAVAPLARVAALVLLWGLPPARADGLGRAAGAPETPALAIAFGLALMLFVVPAWTLVGPGEAALALALAAASLAALALLAQAKIGGVTGDVVGAAVVVAEIALFLGLSM